MADALRKQSRDLQRLRQRLEGWARELGFQQLGVTDVDLGTASRRLREWLQKGYHGDMDYMARHQHLRTNPAELHARTCRVISVRMDYWPGGEMEQHARQLQQPAQAFVARYALGRDYHKLMRKRLQHLARRMEAEIGPFGYRALVDSAPVLEKPLAEKAGLGWIGKHTVLINRQAGSWFFLGELYTDLPLPVDEPASGHCGSCSACMDVCPTGAIVAPYQLDARRCIAYFTIESHDPIPLELRALMGNRVFGCDDCQLYCPWNKFARPSSEADFKPRHGLDSAGLLELFLWDEATFLQRTEGSAIRRLGHERWLRNLAVALGNAPPSREILEALRRRADHDSAMVREHVDWAMTRQTRAMGLR
ncbi:MAG: tRNA epoxyqueuosine(34) reductase QueG [Ectothiorhodospiraceae bacterium]|nr:tRNA epoxyqueuosine(34) reductase QueG [Ectothiorhodospiraceae bacterium]MCH8503090.1 tRNA epoxyqueuosine(34) reductase QueG [Ectothiorhodospiraceae bacterium]